MLMWYDDENARDSMIMIGLVEVERGRWVSSDGLKEITDFDGGIIMITRLWLDKPQFDVRTMHMGSKRDQSFLLTSLGDHIVAIKIKTEDLKCGRLVTPISLS